MTVDCILSTPELCHCPECKRDVPAYQAARWACDTRPQVQCLEAYGGCGAMGPKADDEAGAIAAWDRITLGGSAPALSDVRESQPDNTRANSHDGGVTGAPCSGIERVGDE